MVDNIIINFFYKHKISDRDYNNLPTTGQFEAAYLLGHLHLLQLPKRKHLFFDH